MKLFIVGVGRSGTSLLQSILSSHSNIAMPPETGFLRKGIFSFKRHENISYQKFTDLYPRLDRIPPAVFDHHPGSFSNGFDFYRYTLRKIASQEEAEIAGDKDPKLIEYISGTAMLWSESKFIHLVRDPRDVLLSKKKAAWSKGKPSWYHIFANYVQLKMGEWQGHKLTGKRYVTVTYEDLLAHPEETITQICDFLGIEFEESMLSFQKKAKELISDEETLWKKETMGPLLKNNTGKWKGKLEPWEVALTEQLCQQAFEIGRYQYSRAIKELSFFDKLYVKSVSIMLKGFGYVYMGYRKFYQKFIVWWKR